MLAGRYHYFLSQGLINLALQKTFRNWISKNLAEATDLHWPHPWYGKTAIYFPNILNYVIIGEEIVICSQ